MKTLSSLTITCVLICLAGQSAKAQWASRNPGFLQATSIASISAPSNQIVWLAGRDTSQSVPGNRFARSINGGSSWSQFTLAGFSSYTPSNICALNGDTAWAALYNSTGGGGIFRTNNGGTTWAQQTSATFTAPDGFPNFVHFFDANNGVCMGDPNGGYFEIYTTTNGGAAWTRVSQSNIPANQNQEYGTVNKFSTSGNFISFVTSKGRIFSSSDKGLSWSYRPILMGTDTAFVQWVQPKNDTSLLALCFHPTSGPSKLAKSSDAGSTWQTFDWVGTLDYQNISYQHLSASAGMFLTLSGSDAHFSYDNGLNWRALSLNLENSGLYNEGAIGVSGGGSIWVGGRSLNSSQTGLMQYTVPLQDLAATATQVNGGKTACFGKDTLEVKIINTGSSTISFDSIGLNVVFSLQARQVGSFTFSAPSDLIENITTGSILPGEAKAVKWSAGTLNASNYEYLISTKITLTGASAQSTWNDTTNTIYINGPRIISIYDSVSAETTTALYAGSKAELRCSGAIGSIQWQSRALNGAWTNEPGATTATLQFTATSSKYYRAIICNGEITDSILLTVLEGKAVGYTYYDNQTNSSINNRIQYSGTTLSAVFTGSMDPTNTTTADRGSFYNHNNGSAWDTVATSRIESFRTGFPSLAITSTGKELVVAHSGSQKLSLFKRTTAGSGAWTETIDFAKGMWPRIAAGDGDTIHVIGLDTSISIGAKIRYYRSVNAGTSWDIAVDLPGYTVANGFALTNAETYAIYAKGSVVAIVAGGNTNKLELWKSVDAGQSWTTKTIKTFPAGFDGNTTLPLTLTTDGIISLLIDQQNEVNVFTGKMFLQDDVAGDGSWSYFPNTDGLLFWKDSWATDSLVEIATAAQTSYIPGDFVLVNSAGLCSYPSASINKNDGSLYVTFSVPVSATNDNFSLVNKRDVFGMMSIDGGSTWSVPQNLTRSANSGIDNGYASTANASDGKVHLLWQSSKTSVARNDGRVSLKTILHSPLPYSKFESITLNPLSSNKACGNDSIEVSFSSIGLFSSVAIELSSDYNFTSSTVLSTFPNTNSAVVRKIKVPNSLKSGTYYIRVVGSSGTTSPEFNPIDITPISPKPIITNTRPLTFCNGDSTLLNVDTAQIGTLNHVWVVNGVMDSTSVNRLQYSVKTSAAVQVIVNPMACSSVSDTVFTIRNANQAITVNLTPDTIVCAGTTLTLKAIVLTGTPTSFQWRQGTTVIGTNSPNLVITSASASSAGKYTISINSQCAIFTSDTIRVDVNTVPTITQQPSSLTTCDGSIAVFRIRATSLGTTTYQWKKGTQLLGTSDSLMVLNAAITDTGSYVCMVTNSCGTTTSQAATLTLTEALSIQAPLLDTVSCLGNPFQFKINATGSAIRYAWYKDSTFLDSSMSLSFPSLALKDSGYYFVRINNSCGSLVSNIAHLGVINASLVSLTLLAGDTLLASLRGPYTSLAWYVNDSLIAGATDTLLVAPKSGVYTARVSSGGGCSNLSQPLSHLMTGVASTSLLPKINIYPNPTSSILSVDGLGGLSGNLYLVDLLGKTVRHEKIAESIVVLDVSDLITGIYLIKVETSIGLVVQRVLVKH
jgi:uncharacterized protein YfiM (DUF2279 family)